MAAAAKRKFPWRSVLQRIHLWLGMLLCVPLITLGITGSILVFHREIEDLFDARSAHAMAVGARHSPAEIVAAAQATDPTRAPLMLRLPSQSGEPATVRLSRPRSADRVSVVGGPFAGGIQLLVDPVSLDILEMPGPAPTVLRTIHDLHGNLLISGRDGRVAVGWLGVAMLFMGLSGLILWWPRSRWAAAFTVKRGARGFRLHRELHGAIGIWSLVVFIIVSFSGTYLAFPQEIGAVVTGIFSGRDLRAAGSALRVQPVRDAAPINLDQAVAAARSIIGDGALRVAFLPTRPDQAIRLGFVRDGYVDGAPMITVFVDPWAGRVLEVQDPRAFTVGETILAWQRTIHEGSGLGPVYRSLVFLSGTTIPVFVVTGITMWTLKRRANSRVETARRNALRVTAGSTAADLDVP